MDEINFSVLPLQPKDNNNKGVSEDKAIPEESEPSKEAVTEITVDKEADNETIQEELKPSKPSAKAKKDKKKNAKIAQEEASTSNAKPAADEGKEAMASENKAIPEESKPSKEAVPEITDENQKEFVVGEKILCYYSTCKLY